MTKYHISKETGEPGRCVAQKRPCPLGSHFTDLTIAKEFSSKLAASEFGNTKQTISMVQKQKTAYRELGTLAALAGKDLYELSEMSSEEFKESFRDRLVAGNYEADPLNDLDGVNWNSGEMPPEIFNIVHRNFELGNTIKQNYGDQEVDVYWAGPNTNLAPADVVVVPKGKSIEEGDRWSLKDGSLIVKNQGFSSLNSEICGTDFKKGTNPLYNYAPNEVQAELDYALSKYKETKGEDIAPTGTQWETWAGKDTGAVTRKKLSRFIESELKEDKDWHALQEKRSEVFTKAVISNLKDYNQISSGNILSNPGEAYFYGYTAQSTEGFHAKSGKVPSSEDIDRSGSKVTNISAETSNDGTKVVGVDVVPGRQATIAITHENIRGEKLITLHEIRYSHGQLNGTPEAKAKVAPPGDLLGFLN